MGDFCADAYRVITGADVGFINGGGIRGDIDEGDITFNELWNVIQKLEVTSEGLDLEFDLSILDINSLL